MNWARAIIPLVLAGLVLAACGKNSADRGASDGTTTRIGDSPFEYSSTGGPYNVVGPQTEESKAYDKENYELLRIIPLPKEAVTDRIDASNASYFPGRLLVGIYRLDGWSPEALLEFFRERLPDLGWEYLESHGTEDRYRQEGARLVVNGTPLEETGQFALGVHTMSAIGYTSDGQELQSNELTAEFVPASAATETITKIVIPLFAVIGGIILITTIGPFLLGRGKTGSVALGSPRNYGVFGGAICPRCERPFARHIWGMNLVVGKLDRCPHCGKWSIVRAQPLSVLRAAEQAELDNADTEGRLNVMSEEERLRKELENSRYQDL